MLTRKILFGLAIALLAATNVVAQDVDMQAKKMLDRATKTTTANMMRAFAKAELTEDQKTKAAAIVEKHMPALMEARKAQASVMTAERMEKLKAAYAKNKEDGLKGAEAMAATYAAMGLTDEDKAKYDEGKKKLGSVTATIMNEITALLTDEQKAALPKMGKKMDGDMKKAEGAAQAVSLKLPNMT